MWWYLEKCIWVTIYLERGSSVVECRTRNRESPGLNPPFATISKFVLFTTSQSTQLYEYLAIDSGGNLSEYSSRAIAAWLECFPEKSSWCRNEQVCQGVKCKAL